MTGAAPSGADQLDGLVPTVQASPRFDVTDIDGNLLGVLAVDRSQPPRLSNDTSRSIRRQLDNVVVAARPVGDASSFLFAEDVDPLTMRVRLSWVLGTGDEYPTGIFVWGDDSTMLWSWGQPRRGILLDLCVLLDQPLDANAGYPAGTTVTDALAEQAQIAGIGAAARTIETSTASLAEPIAWAAGRDRRLAVMESLCALAGFLPPYFDNSGVLVCRSAPDLSVAPPDATYGFGNRVVPGSAVLSSDILNAPNRYIVVNSSAVTAPLVGTFDVPDNAPNSFANIGRRIVDTRDLQGLTDQAAADAAAAAAYAGASATYTWLQFDSSHFDPREDTFDVVAFDGVNYRQLSWSTELAAGARMQHQCRGTYQ